MKTTNSFTQSRFLLYTAIISGFLLSSCIKKEGCTDSEAENYDPDANKDCCCEYDTSLYVPTTYNFVPVTYGGQTVRLLLLGDLVDEIASGSATASSLNAIYENTSELYSDISSGKNLKDKVASDEVNDSIQVWFTNIENLSGNYVRNDSVDLKQMVEKTLMGAVFYYRAVNDYLMNLDDDDNSEIDSEEGTEMEHHWDEAFGYFGAARDYNNYTDSEIKSEGENDANGDNEIDPESEKCFYFAVTAAKRDLGAENNAASGQTDYTKNLFDAWLTGRAAIGDLDYEIRDAQIAIIRENWEAIIAATAVHYINETNTDIAGSDWSNLKKHWSELRGYFNALQYDSENILGETNFNTISAYIGNKPADATVANLDLALGILKSSYGFTDEQILNW